MEGVKKSGIKRAKKVQEGSNRKQIVPRTQYAIASY